MSIMTDGTRCGVLVVVLPTRSSHIQAVIGSSRISVFQNRNILMPSSVSVSAIIVV